MGDESLKKFTWEEVKEHRSSESLWIVVEGKVYDVTEFLDEVRATYLARRGSLSLSFSLLASWRGGGTDGACR